MDNYAINSGTSFSSFVLCGAGYEEKICDVSNDNHVGYRKFIRRT